MKALTLCLVSSLLLSSHCFGQKEVSKVEPSDGAKELLLDSIIQLAKANAYNAASVDWEQLSTEMFEIAERHDSIEAIGKPAEHMFKALRDDHGMLMYDYKVAFSYTSPAKDASRDSVWGAVSRAKISLPYEVVGQMLDESIAYIEIVGTGVMQEADIALGRDKIREVICSLKAENPKGWIVDLRCNTGGNMHPMMAGLGELIPDADLGGDTKDGETFYSTWAMQDGNFLENGYAHYGAPLKCAKLKNNAKIAVLTSRYTASAGEVVASSLKGQRNVKLIGEKTAGLSSTNGWHVLPDKWVLAPMSAYFMSQDKTVHKDGIAPNIAVKEELDLDHLLTGKTIDSAKEWIEQAE
jgi:hypothetical protein